MTELKEKKDLEVGSRSFEELEEAIQLHSLRHQKQIACPKPVRPDFELHTACAGGVQDVQRWNIPEDAARNSGELITVPAVTSSLPVFKLSTSRSVFAAESQADSFPPSLDGREIFSLSPFPCWSPFPLLDSNSLNSDHPMVKAGQSKASFEKSSIDEQNGLVNQNLSTKHQVDTIKHPSSHKDLQRYWNVNSSMLFPANQILTNLSDAPIDQEIVKNNNLQQYITNNIKSALEKKNPLHVPAVPSDGDKYFISGSPKPPCNTSNHQSYGANGPRPLEVFGSCSERNVPAVCGNSSDECGSPQRLKRNREEESTGSRWHRDKHREYSRAWRQKKKTEVTHLKDEIESLRKFKAIVEDAPVLMALVSVMPKFPLIFANAAYQRLVNITGRDIFQQPFCSIVHPEDQTGLTQTLTQACGALDPPYVTYRVTNPKLGKVFLVESSFRRVPEGLIIVSTVKSSWFESMEVATHPPVPHPYFFSQTLPPPPSHSFLDSSTTNSTCLEQYQPTYLNSSFMIKPNSFPQQPQYLSEH